MISSNIPTKFSIPFANSATGAYITKPIPVPSQIGIGAGRASLTDGFPPLTFTQLAAGGDPPWGADFNGLLNEITSWLVWVAAGGAPVAYDVAFSTAIGGYPSGAFLQSTPPGHYWISTADNNATDPDTGGAGWSIFPDILIQQQAGNYAAVDSGAVNHVAVTLSPVPASLPSIVGSPIRFLIANANTITTPTININGLGAVTMINTDGSSIVIGQFSRAGQMCEGYLTSPTVFQVTTPGKPASGGGGGAAGGVPTGGIILCPVEIPLPGFLECDGSTKNISAYPNLFNVIKATYGGDGINTFKVPDLRGAFARGWDHGRGLDPSASTRTNRGDGTTGDHVGTWEAQANGPYSSSVSIANPQVNWPAFSNLAGSHTWPGGTANFLLGQDVAEFDVYGQTNYGFTGDTLPNNSVTINPPQYPLGGSPQVVTLPSTNSQNGIYFFGPGGVYITSLTGTITLSGPETRPVNINMMYIIAY
jgi:microcystin-dependent protein